MVSLRRRAILNRGDAPIGDWGEAQANQRIKTRLPTLPKSGRPFPELLLIRLRYGHVRCQSRGSSWRYIRLDNILVSAI